MKLSDRLISSWYEQAPVPWWCVPLEKLYGWLGNLHRSAYRRGWLRPRMLSLPVMVVGNLTVGGTGKTPLTLALVEAMRARGYHPGVVSRGYGGTQREPCLLTEMPDPAQVGDEPCLLKASAVPVAVGRDRAAAARLLQNAGCDLIVSDDGLQHYRLGRHVEIAVVDGIRRFGNGRLLPAGPLREPCLRWHRMEFRVCNGGRALSTEIPMQLESSTACCLLDGREQPLEAFRGQRVHAVAGIGHPERFFDSLRAYGLDVMVHPFADHHAFVPADLAFAEGWPLLMTVKDAVKCRSFAQAHWWSVPVRACLPESFFDAVASQIVRAQMSLT